LKTITPVLSGTDFVLLDVKAGQQAVRVDIALSYACRGMSKK
jgi:hypothetical protein